MWRVMSVSCDQRSSRSGLLERRTITLQTACSSVTSTYFKMWLNDAPARTPEIVDGLSGRSRVAVNGTRHTIYFIKQLIVDLEGKFAKTLVKVGKVKDPITLSQPSLIQVTTLCAVLFKPASVAFSLTEQGRHTSSRRSAHPLHWRRGAFDEVARSPQPPGRRYEAAADRR